MFCRAIWKTFNSGARLYLIVKVRLHHGASFILSNCCPRFLKLFHFFYQGFYNLHKTDLGLQLEWKQVGSFLISQALRCRDGDIYE